MPNSQMNGDATQRIDERLREIEMRVVALQENAFGPARKFLPDAHQVVALIFEIEIVRDAVAERVIGGGVAEEAVLVGLDDIDRQRPADQHDADRGGAARAQPPGQAASLRGGRQCVCRSSSSSSGS